MDTEAEEATTSSAARRRSGQLLADVRAKTGLSLAEAGAVIQRSAATLSRLERGLIQKPRLTDVRPLLDHYRSVAPSTVDEDVVSLILRLTEQGAAPAWFSKFRDVIGGPMTAGDAQQYIEYENDASVIRTYEPEAIPGLLQTERYAVAMTEVFLAAYAPAQRARFVELRLARQQVLDRQSEQLELDVVLGELALRRRLADDDVMREQLQQLLDVSEKRSNVSLRIAPIELGHKALYGGSYVVMDLADPDENGVVYLESRAAPVFDRDDAEVDRFRLLHADLSGAVLSVSKSRSRIEEVLKELS
jgi:hypothetical protein